MRELLPGGWARACRAWVRVRYSRKVRTRPCGWRSARTRCISHGIYTRTRGLAGVLAASGGVAGLSALAGGVSARPIRDGWRLIWAFPPCPGGVMLGVVAPRPRRLAAGGVLRRVSYGPCSGFSFWFLVLYGFQLFDVKYQQIQ